MLKTIKALLLSILTIILLFLPIHLIKPTLNEKDLDYSIIQKVDIDKFKPEIGKEGGVLVEALGSDPKTFNPALAQETSSTAVIGYLFKGLTN